MDSSRADRKTRVIVGVYIGDRSKESAEKLWESLPPVYRQCAVCYTDFDRLRRNITNQAA